MILVGIVIVVVTGGEDKFARVAQGMDAFQERFHIDHGLQVVDHHQMGAAFHLLAEPRPFFGQRTGRAATAVELGVEGVDQGVAAQGRLGNGANPAAQVQELLPRCDPGHIDPVGGGKQPAHQRIGQRRLAHAAHALNRHQPGRGGRVEQRCQAVKVVGYAKELAVGRALQPVADGGYFFGIEPFFALGNPGRQLFDLLTLDLEDRLFDHMDLLGNLDGGLPFDVVVGQQARPLRVIVTKRLDALL